MWKSRRRGGDRGQGKRTRARNALGEVAGVDPASVGPPPAHGGLEAARGPGRTASRPPSSLPRTSVSAGRRGPRSPLLHRLHPCRKPPPPTSGPVSSPLPASSAAGRSRPCRPCPARASSRRLGPAPPPTQPGWKGRVGGSWAAAPSPFASSGLPPPSSCCCTRAGMLGCGVQLLRRQ